MTQTLLYDDGTIKVYQEDYLGPRGTIYLITDNYYAFSTSDCPELSTTTLHILLTHYLVERELRGLS